jgi:hypothetical protein
MLAYHEKEVTGILAVEVEHWQSDAPVAGASEGEI